MPLTPGTCPASAQPVGAHRAIPRRTQEASGVRPDINFADRVALVTGAASRIGAAVATRLAAAGAHVAVADNDGLGAERMACVIRETGGHAEPVAVDGTDAASVKAAVTATVAKFGALHLVVNSAGVTGPAALTGDADEDRGDFAALR